MHETMKVGTRSAHLPDALGESKGQRDPVARAYGQRIGQTPDSARKILYSGDLPYRVVEAIGAFDDVHEFERRERWLAPIRAALLKVAFEPFSADLMRKAQAADAAEEVAQTEFQLSGGPVERDRYVRALIEQATTSYALAMALIREKREAAA
jgi:hypothetical protein